MFDYILSLCYDRKQYDCITNYINTMSFSYKQNQYILELIHVGKDELRYV